jgi:hypothetical protein
MRKILYTTREARDAIGCGVTRLYEHINAGRLDARRFGRRTFITSESLHAFVASLAPAVTPSMAKRLAPMAADAKAAHAKWTGQRKPRVKSPEGEAGAGG